MAVGLLLLVAAVAANEMRMLIDHFDVDHNGHLDCVELGYWQDAIHPDQRGGGGGCHVPTMDGDHVLALIGDDAEPVLNGRNAPPNPIFTLHDRKSSRGDPHVARKRISSLCHLGDTGCVLVLLGMFLCEIV